MPYVFLIFGTLTTKEKILFSSLFLFNKKGVGETSMRDIAEECKMSVGNLTYHFKKRDDLVYELFLQLVEEMNVIFNEQLGLEKASVQNLFETTVVTYRCLLKYKFCMIDFVQLMKQIPRIQKVFQELMEVRKVQFEQLFKTAVETGLLKSEEFSGQYHLFTASINVYGDFWISNAEILHNGTQEEAIKQYSIIFLNMFYPYFTDSSKKEFHNLLSYS